MSSSFLRIGLAQFNIRWEDPSANFKHLESLMQFDEGLDFLLLPEMWSTGFTMSPETSAEPSPGPALNWMIENARRHNFVIGGSVAVEDNGQFFNRWYGVYPDGKVVSYDKKHLFSFGKEDLHYTPGQTRPLIEISGWKIMPIVCYDLRFPVWCRNTSGYDVLVVVANWPTPRIHHWDALLRARAIENQSYVAAVNRIGSDGNGLQYPGHSSIHDMNGSTLMDLKDQEGIGVYTLDQLALTQYRDHFRFLQDQDKFTV
ncbi:MAG: amidohydrolase [Saprospiraceae bacterium]|uniref:Omega-amidase YafV n=1 Tax=Candidatus Opimibacter skivensis TaxID=2982028 RepID=A0A9D7SV24_9BACT|nr:amidohydrolase [Candidatus Opimibacter skivensis]